MEHVLTALLLLVGLTAVIATLVVLASRKLSVFEDPRIDVVEDMLPHTNCGACGYPGCRPFAEALAGGEALPGKCTVSSERGLARIAEYLGVEVGEQVKRVARLACAGGNNVARNRAKYVGLSSCAAAAQVAGGGKGCFWGCLGAGDCVSACTFGAIRMDAHDLPEVDPELCTACGDCVTACPKDLFSILPVDRPLFVRCKSQERGEAALADCDVACDACGRCAMDAPELISMKRNLPVIDLSRPHNSVAIERCPTGAIVYFDSRGIAQKGAAAAKVIRHEPRSPAFT